MVLVVKECDLVRLLEHLHASIRKNETSVFRLSGPKVTVQIVLSSSGLRRATGSHQPFEERRSIIDYPRTEPQCSERV